MTAPSGNRRGKGRGPRLRFVLAVAFIVVGLTPAIILASWLHSRALDAQVADVSERSLLLAKTLSRFIADHVADTARAFALISNHSSLIELSVDMASTGAEMGLTEICRLDSARKPLERMRYGTGAGCLPKNPLELWSNLDQRKPAGGAGIAISGVMRADNDEPGVYLVQFENQAPATVAHMSLSKLRDLRKSIAFGEKGHAAIVDHAGNIVSHPRPDWETAIKNIAKVDPVARMIAGETGISRFFSPAAKVHMIAGYAAIPSLGWGVMVPQPEEELAFHAEEVRMSAQFALIAGLILGAVLAWWFAGRLTAPIAEIEAASDRLAAGDLSVRVDEANLSGPEEVTSLAQNFNVMAARMESREQERERILKDLREMHGATEQRVAERTLELTAEITERDRAEKELLKSKAEVEYANRAKTEFLAHMSHELRTPLNAINGFAEVLRDTDAENLKPDQVRKYAQYIYESGGLLLKLINDLLDISRIEAGALKLDIDDVDINEVVESCLPIVSDRATRAGLILNVDVDPNMGVIRGDATRLRQILLNLIINAVKFTPDGGEIDVRARPVPGGGVEFIVADTGIGIPAEDMDRVMKPFNQARQSQVNKGEGTGLGLPLAHSFSVMHGGTLRLESEPGRGTTATVFIPTVVPGDPTVSN